MQVAPFLVPGLNQQSMSMGMNFHLVPQTHALFFGPAECARHTFPTLADDPHASMLIVDDVQTSLGRSDQLVADAVLEICQMDPEVQGFLLCTACQTMFLGIDLDGLCADLHQRTGLAFAHIEANRMSADNIPGRQRKIVPGGDRYHTRRAFTRMLAQVERDPNAPRGIAVLSDEPLDASNELLAYARADGIDWVISVGDCATMADFLALRNAVACIALAPAWDEPMRWLSKHLGIPGIYASTSYSLAEIGGYYEKLDSLLLECGIEKAGLKAVQRRIAHARQRASATIDELLETFHGTPLELDLRVVGRPFSLVETLLDYGFKVIDMQPSYESIQHKEADDAPAFERLCEREPGLALRFAQHGSSQTRKGGTSTRNARRSGRFKVRPALIATEHVPEEVSWWGYASIAKLAAELDNALLYDGRARGAAGIRVDAAQTSPERRMPARQPKPGGRRESRLFDAEKRDRAAADNVPAAKPEDDEGKWAL